MLIWNSQFGTAVRGLQGLACVCDRRLGFYEEFADLAETAAVTDFASVADWTMADFTLPDFASSLSDLPTVDAYAFNSMGYDELAAPIDAGSNSMGYDELAAQPTSGEYIPASASDAQYEYAGSVDAYGGSQVVVPAADVAQPIGNVLGTAGSAASAVLKAVLTNAPAAINAATALLKPTQKAQAQAALAQGQIPAGYGVNARGELVPLRPQSIVQSAIDHVRSNPGPYIVGAAAVAVLIVSRRKSSRRKKARG